MSRPTQLLKQILKTLVPRSWIARTNRRIAARIDRQFEAKSPAEVFEAVYRRRIWGGSETQDFYSGEGSNDPEVVGPYVAAVVEFLASLPRPPRVVDLGCGDFNVGSRLRGHCSEYVACDIVQSLIDRNNVKFADRDVEFRVLDVANDPLPSGDVVFIRQVMQHMSNAQILELLPKMRQYAWAVITEHLPSEAGFAPNVDKPAGPGIRIGLGSGVVLAAPPFNFTARSEHEICVVHYLVGTIRTVVYELAD
jgi:SAM-dependent methyltransferase